MTRQDAEGIPRTSPTRVQFQLDETIIKYRLIIAYERAGEPRAVSVGLDRLVGLYILGFVRLFLIITESIV